MKRWVDRNKLPLISTSKPLYWDIRQIPIQGFLFTLLGTSTIFQSFKSMKVEKIFSQEMEK